jgi:hypothetical protein
VLRLDGELDRRALAELVTRPQSIEQVEAQIAAERLLDHFAVTSPGPGRANPYRPEHILVDREGGASFRHFGILAS